MGVGGGAWGGGDKRSKNKSRQVSLVNQDWFVFWF